MNKVFHELPSVVLCNIVGPNHGAAHLTAV